MSNRATTLQKEIEPGCIDLAVGHPDPQLLPIRMVEQAACARLADAAPELLQYSYEQGDGHFREELAGFLSGEYGTELSADSLFIDTGVSQGLDLFCTHFTSPGDTVLVEEPSYFLALKIFRDHHLRVVSVPTDEHGADTSALRSIAERERPVFFYTIPAHQNPSGFVQPDPRRQEVVDIAGDCGFIILADEVYHMLTYEGRSPRPFAAYLGSGRVVSLGSFSKISAPGLRLGWFQAPQTMLDRIFSSGLLDSGGGLNPLVAAVMCRALEEGGVQRHLYQLRERYRSRRDAMQRALSEEMQELAEWRLPTGGFFFWLHLKRGDARRLQQPARAEKVSFLPGSGFSTEERYADHIRLCFTHYPEEELQEGVRRLAAALRQLSGR